MSAARTGNNGSTHRRALSRRELSVMGLLADGWNNKSIAGRLGVTVSTVEAVIGHCIDKVFGELRDDGKNQRVLLARELWEAGRR